MVNIYFLKEESIQRIFYNINNCIHIQQNSPLARLKQNPCIVFQIVLLIKFYNLQLTRSFISRFTVTITLSG